jgi:hypothetical protein
VIRILVIFLLLAGNAAAQSADPTPIRRSVSDPPLYVRAEAGLERMVDEVFRLWPDASREVAAGLQLEDPAPLEIVLLTSRTWDRWARGLVPEWGVAFANWPYGPIAIDAGRAVRDPARFPRTLRHEVSHVYLGQRLGGRRPPSWFIEGVAQVQAGQWHFGDTIGLVQVASVGAIPRLHELHTHFPSGGRRAEMAYRVSRQAVGEIDRIGSDRGGWRAMLGPLAAGTNFANALHAVTGLRPIEFEGSVENRLRIRYGWVAAVASATSLFGIMTVLFLIGVARARVRTRRRLREMELEEALLDVGPQ